MGAREMSQAAAEPGRSRTVTYLAEDGQEVTAVLWPEGYDPTEDKIIVRKDPERVSQGGVIIPETARGYQRAATIVAVGPGRLTPEGRVVEPKARVGDRVLCYLHKGVEVDLGGVPHFVMREGDIMIRIGSVLGR